MRYPMALFLMMIFSVNTFAQISKFDKEYPRYTGTRNTKSIFQFRADSSLVLKKIATDPNYGYTEKAPIMLGLAQQVDSAAMYRTHYLEALAGPKGEPITYERLPPCCPFRTPNQLRSHLKQDVKQTEFGLLERYRISYAGLKEPVILYINIYDEGELLAPMGFSIRK